MLQRSMAARAGPEQREGARTAAREGSHIDDVRGPDVIKDVGHLQSSARRVSTERRDACAHGDDLRGPKSNCRVEGQPAGDPSLTQRMRDCGQWLRARRDADCTAVCARAGTPTAQRF